MYDRFCAALQCNCAAHKLIMYRMRTKALRIFLHVIVWMTIYLLPYFVAYGKISLTSIFREPNDIVYAVFTVLLITYAYLNH